MDRRRSSSKPKWWQLYLSFPLLMGFFMIDTRLHLSERGHEFVQLGSLALEYAYLQLWLHWNAAALRHLHDVRIESSIAIYTLPAAEPAKFKSSPEAALDRPREIRGVLGDTFEWDCAERESEAAELSDWPWDGASK